MRRAIPSTRRAAACTMVCVNACHVDPHRLSYCHINLTHAAQRLLLSHQWRTEWTELLPSQRPHFMREDTVALKLDPAATAAIAAAASDSPVKL